jgi:glycosyltransferase involved in cell wall biosynthesis
MRITIATGPCFPYPALRGGGMIRVWQSLAPLFAKEGHEVCLLARLTPGQAQEEINQGVRILRQGGFDQSAYTPINLFRDFFYAMGALRHLPPADILITNDFWMPFLTPHLKKKAGAVVVSVNRFPKHQMFLYSRAGLLITPTLILAEAIKKQTPSMRKQVISIPNPYSAADFFFDASIKKDPGSILYVGRLHPEKGVHLLIQAFRKIQEIYPSACLSIVGPHKTEEGGGGATYLEHLRSLAQGWRIHFTPPVYEAKALAAIYRQHQIFCYPSLADQGEAMGIAPLEAMACGCIPIVSKNPVFNDWLKSGQNGWSFDHQCADPVEALALRLQSLLENPGLSRQLQDHALETVRFFESHSIAQSFLRHFKNLV